MTKFAINISFQYFLLILTVVGCFVFFGHDNIVNAQSEINTLKNEIGERNNRLKEIEAEIASYQIELKKVGGQKSSLQKAVTQLELERKKVEADISYTQNKIGMTDLEIEKLALEISETEKSITLNKEAISETIQSLSEIDNNSLVEVLLQYDNLSEFWNKIDELSQIRRVISDEVKLLTSREILLEEKYSSTNKKRGTLVNLKDQYSDQNSVLIENRTEKSKLLSATKNEEASYQKLLKDKEAAREKILKELRDFEAKLQFILDPNTIPTRGTVVFNWPVENYVITQLFGGTEFAKQNASVYGGRAYHPGVDFGVPRGTKIFAPLSGTVRATGDTDLVQGCYSWGKWTLIDHANGLSTLYAHQSLQSVVPGQQVKTGEVIGYSGNTGYSTGPHLHFTVYAKAGVTVRKFNEIKAVTSCGAATTPVAASDAYIDPMVYLPQ
ncbi:MAG: peptidoglycan DD-metalloendopeptidase family protein [Candidatus Pacebacteria bacterium]|nr:peptidoglycan DD-metalloendopeptidase family protein [Candidatus Paceibacterota bacterium]MCF7857105.1 peptidoglycan DD-metalloendopeptidase family protein [Candidatus Paceibacterota bacterium]